MTTARPAKGRVPATTDRRTGALSDTTLILILGFVLLAAYANSFQAGFAVDNRFILLEDPRIRAAGWENLKLVFTREYWYPTLANGLYRPLTTLSYMLDYAVLGHGERPAGYHALNLLLHWLNAVLVFKLMRRLLAGAGPAFFAALLFGVHPVATEAVTNIIGRADLLSTAAVLGGVLIYARAAETGGRARIGWFGLLALTATLGLFAKESTVALAGVIVAYDLALRFGQRPGADVNVSGAGSASASRITDERSRGKRLDRDRSAAGVQGHGAGSGPDRRVDPEFAGGIASSQGPGSALTPAGGFSALLGGMAAIAPAFALFALAKTQLLGGLLLTPPSWLDNPLVRAGFLPARLTAVKVLGSYIGLLFWPVTLSCDYSFNQVPIVSLSFGSWEDWKSVVALVTLVAVLAVAVLSLRRSRAVFFLILLSLIAIFPVSNLLVLIGSIKAERFLYLPLAGFAGCIPLAVFAATRRLGPSRAILGPAVLAVLALALGARTVARNFDWKDNVTIWSKAVEAAPASYKAHQNLAHSLFSEVWPAGRSAEILDRAIREGERSIEIAPDTPEMLMSLGGFYIARGDSLSTRSPDGARALGPESREAYEKAVGVLLRARAADRAENEEIRKREIARGARAEDLPVTGDVGVYFNLASVYRRLSRDEDVLATLGDLLRIAPEEPEAWLSLGSIRASRGEMEQAAIAYTTALLIAPANADAQRLVPGVYRRLDPGGCAVRMAEGSPDVDWKCPFARDLRCDAW